MAAVRKLVPILLATVWISISEFVRNNLLLHSLWIGHYRNLGIDFPSSNLNGALWGVWSLCLALLIYVLLTKFRLIEAALIAWFAAFAMMWLVIGNLSVLPPYLLFFATPLSLVEVFMAAWIIDRSGK